MGGSKDQGDEFVGTEYFEMREEEVLARERFGRFVEDTEQTLGQVVSSRASLNQAFLCEEAGLIPSHRF